MAVTDPGLTRLPLAVPDAFRPGDGLARPVRATRPPTLGDRLNDVLRQRGQTTDQAAHAMGALTADVLAWTADAAVPDRTFEPALTAYLQVDVPQLRALVLRGQMRRIQASIRG